MWARVVELMTGVWLLLSPFIFSAQADAFVLWLDLLAAGWIALCSGLSFWPPTRLAYLANLLLATSLIVIGRFSDGSPPIPPHQNHIFVGFFLLMIAVIPNQASRPPQPWRQQAKQSQRAN